MQPRNTCIVPNGAVFFFIGEQRIFDLVLICRKRFIKVTLTMRCSPMKNTPMCSFIAQLVEHRTGIAEVMGSNPVEALIFFRLLLSICLNWKIYCNDHTSLSYSGMFANCKYEELSYPKNQKMCDPILVTLLKMRPHDSQSSRENATPSSSTSPLASYKEVAPGK